MSRISNDPKVLAELQGLLIEAGIQQLSNLAAPGAQTGAALAITYTSNDPAITGDGSVTVADGNSITAAETAEVAEEIVQFANQITADITAIRTALDSIISTGTSGVSLAAMTATNDAPLSISFTTNDPAVTADGSMATIASGNTVTGAVLDEAIEEFNAEYSLVQNDVSRIHAAVRKILDAGLHEAPVLAARTSANGGLGTFTYTSNDPTPTINAAITVADGAAIAGAEFYEILEEASDQLDKAGDDFTALKTAYDLLLLAASRPTS